MIASDSGEDELEIAWKETGKDPKIRSILTEERQAVPKENPKEKRKMLERIQQGKKTRPTAFEKMMKKEVSNFNHTMRNRIRKIGATDVADEHFQDTLRPGEAVVGALLKYHTHCHGLGKFYAFKQEDKSCDEAAQQKKLQSLIHGLQDEPLSGGRPRRGSRRRSRRRSVAHC